jgi:hypothetical protein
MRLLERSEVKKVFDLAVDETEAQLFHEIKTKEKQRPELLAQLDLLQKLRSRINARIEYIDPTGTE